LGGLHFFVAGVEVCVPEPNKSVNIEGKFIIPDVLAGVVTFDPLHVMQQFCF
jgi:hypothetical protein